MKFYIEITLIDNDELSACQLWEVFYTQLHLAFVEIKNDQNHIPVGVGFPSYRYDVDKKIGFLGDKLRLYSPEKEILENINIGKWLNRLEDYIHKTSIREVPLDNIKGYACYVARRFNRSALSRAKRYINRHPEEKMSIQEMARKMARTVNTQGLPFLTLKSVSNGHAYRLFIEEQQTDKAPQTVAHFNTYGLSSPLTNDKEALSQLIDRPCNAQACIPLF